MKIGNEILIRYDFGLVGHNNDVIGRGEIVELTDDDVVIIPDGVLVKQHYPRQRVVCTVMADVGYYSTH
jgi:hypothetical protein